jgi:CBS domain-containing protein
MDIAPAIKKDFLVFSKDTTSSEMKEKLRKHEKKAGLIFDRGKFVGLVEKKKLLAHGQTLTATSSIPVETDLLVAVAAMSEHAVDVIPVEENKEIIGTLHALDLAQMAAALPEADGLHVRDVALAKPSSISDDSSVSMALDIMQAEEISQVPVTKEGSFSGIISHRALLRKYLNWSPRRNLSPSYNAGISGVDPYSHLYELAHMQVDSIAEFGDLASVSPSDSLTTALKKMKENNLANIIVADNGYKGMLTLQGVLQKLRSLAHEDNFTVDFKGVQKVYLTGHQKELLQDITHKESHKLQRRISDPFSVIIHLKDIRNDGTRTVYQVNLRVEWPGKMIASTKQDWDIETALRKCFNSLKKE